MEENSITRVEIAGGIASGKTTLARALQSKQSMSIYEDFRQNPFFEAFYQDAIGAAFETELSFLLQHYHQQKKALKPGKTFYADFSLVLDHAYARVTLPKSELKVFRTVLDEVAKKLPKRTLLIHLVCSPEVEMHRIRRRNRSAERGITSIYLRKIAAELADLVEALPASKVISINSGEIDFANDKQARDRVIRRVEEALATTKKV